eukprot:PhM_4_TR12616/c0_g1_i1/m.34451
MSQHIDEHVKRLSVEQDIRAPYLDRKSGQPDPDDLRRQVTENGHCFVDFEARPGMGVTSLNSKLEHHEFTPDNHLKFRGAPFKLNGTQCRVIADVNMETMTGRGRLEILA